MFALLFVMFHGTVASRRCWYMCVVGRFVGSPCCVSPFKSWHVSLPAAILLNYNLSDSVTYCPSWEANSSSASQEIPRIVWNPIVHCHAHSSPPHVPVLSQLNPEIFAPLWCYATYIGSQLQTFRDKLLFPYSMVKQSKKNAGDT